MANQVNREIGGSNTAVKLLIQRVQLRQEVVTLQALNVVECCVKNCGVKFHNEIGKYKFINELIKLLSPKYDGDITPQSIKDRVIELLFAWYVGLPQEKKIAEAYKMLKQQGIIKRDPVDPYKEGAPHPSREPQNTVFEDEGKSELLKTLLTSTDPEDLHSANKLIKTMVKEEEQRLERVSKRIQDLETVSNNVRLLDDMLAKHCSDVTQSSLEIMHDLYESCLKMRPELFRLASRSAEDKDDSMAEILCASDELTRVIDLYKEKVLLQKFDVSDQKPYHVTPTDNQNVNTSSLLDLGFDAPQPMPPSAKANNTCSETSFLDEQFKLLGLDVADQPVSQPSQQSNMFTQLSQPQQQLSSGNFQMQPPMSSVGYSNQPPFHPTATTALPTNTQPLISAARPPVSDASATPPMSAPNKNSATVPQRRDLLDFDVFSEFRSPELTKTKNGSVKTDAPSQSAVDDLLDISIEDESKNNNQSQPSQQTPVLTQTPALVSNLPSEAANPLVQNAQENYLVSLDALKPTDHPPIPIHDKDNIKSFINIVQDTRPGANTNVIATILSTLSTHTVAVKDFTIQVAVPKVMRVKLQPATSNELAPFNPMLPPQAITQIMLIANPVKENVRLRFKISYVINGVSHVESSSIDQLPIR